ncbi:MAG: SPOR domain-containing protein [Dysgonamonadaceae bacterium]|jgi:hypothetical protein|nr:SPOR domain-containing protein [Dysgonamonadaceae bacterium]
MRKPLSSFLLLCGLSAPVFAQSTIIDSLQENIPGQGIICVNVSAAVSQLAGRKTETVVNGEFVKVSGYRVQVFTGNQQRSSKAEVFERQQAIKEVFPDLPAYITYNAPYWRLRAGDAPTYEEAYLLMKKIAKHLPNLKKEMYIVKDEIKVPANIGRIE